MDKIDMHVHTTASDGTMRPEHVVSLAAMQGLKAIAITDHDTMDGIVEAGKAGELMGVTIIPGIELSTDYQGKEVHVLGYFLDENAPALKEYQSWAAEKRQERNEKILERLRKKGFEITMEQLKAANPDAVIGRPHIARKLVELGAVENVSEAFGGICPRDAAVMWPGSSSALRMRHGSSSAATAWRCWPIPSSTAIIRASWMHWSKLRRRRAFPAWKSTTPAIPKPIRKSSLIWRRSIPCCPPAAVISTGDNKPGVQLGTGDGKLSVPAYFLIMLAQSQYQ